MNNLNSFFHNFPSEFTWFGLLLGLIGIYASFMMSSKLAIFFIITFFSTVFYTINYDIHDLESYFLLAYVVFAFWIALGIRWILQNMRRQAGQFIVIGFVFLGGLYEAGHNFRRVNQNDIYIFEDYTKEALGSLPDNSILLSYQWDYLISPAIYFQFVENYRRDVAVVDKELLRRSWYFDQLRNNYPEIIQKVESEVSSFLTALAPFEQGGDYNPSILEERYRRLIARLVEANAGDRHVFIAPELVEGEFRRRELYLPSGMQMVPDLFFFRVVASDEYVPLRHMKLSIRFPNRGNQYSEVIKNFVSKMFTWRTLYEVQNNRLENAKTLKGIIESHFPGLQLPIPLRDL